MNTFDLIAKMAVNIGFEFDMVIIDLRVFEETNKKDDQASHFVTKRC